MYEKFESLKNYTLVAPTGGVTKKVITIIGGLIGVPRQTVVAGEPFTFAMGGGWAEAPKATGQAWTLGALLYWDSGNSNLTTTSSGNTLVGKALAPAASGDTLGEIDLDM